MENYDNGMSSEGLRPSTPRAKTFSVLAYIGFLWIFGILCDPEKNDPYVRSHLNNGIVLSICTIIPVIGQALSIVWFIFAIMGLVKAFNDEPFDLPIIGDKFKILK